MLSSSAHLQSSKTNSPIPDLPTTPTPIPTAAPLVVKDAGTPLGTYDVATMCTACTKMQYWPEPTNTNLTRQQCCLSFLLYDPSQTPACPSTAIEREKCPIPSALGSQIAYRPVSTTVGDQVGILGAVVLPLRLRILASLLTVLGFTTRPTPHAR